MLENEQSIDVSTSRPSSAFAPAPATPSQSDEPETAVDTGAEAAFAGPASPHEYRFDRIGSAEYSDADMQAEQGIRAALHAEGIPAGVASLGHMLIQDAVRNGLPDDAALELGRRTGEAEMQRRHGARAPEVIRQAREVFARLDKRNPRIGDVLVDSGVANSPEFIEALARLAGVRGRK